MVLGLTCVLGVLTSPGCDGDDGGVAHDASSDVIPLLPKDGTDDGGYEYWLGTDTAPAADSTGCSLTEADCEANGQILDPGRCWCTDGTCRARGDLCDAELAQPPEFECVDGGDDVHVCTSECICPDGSACLEPHECEAVECVSFFANDCPGGHHCLPARDGGWACRPSGDIAEGEPCDELAECDTALLCVDGVCAQPDCGALTGTPSCPTGDGSCDGLTIGGQAVDIGFCTRACTPWVSTQASGCAPGQVCQPSLDIDDTGRCISGSTPGESIPAGERCNNTASACTRGTRCIPTGELDAKGVEIWTCATVCDPHAAQGEAGACAPDADGSARACGALFDARDDVVYEVGTCFADACDVADGSDCPPGPDGTTRVCVTGPFRFSEHDFCVRLPGGPIDAYAECPVEDFAEFDACNTNAICLDLAGSTGDRPLCVPLCDSDELGFGEPGHPECVHADAGADMCARMFDAPYDRLGVCM